MSSAAIAVSRAEHWAEAITTHFFRGPGDTVEAAMERASKRTGVPYRTFWSLRYRKPKDLLASIYLTLEDAFDDLCQRQEAKLRQELQTFERIAGDAAINDPAYRAAKAALEAMEKTE